MGGLSEKNVIGVAIFQNSKIYKKRVATFYGIILRNSNSKP